MLLLLLMMMMRLLLLLMLMMLMLQPKSGRRLKAHPYDALLMLDYSAVVAPSSSTSTSVMGRFLSSPAPPPRLKLCVMATDANVGRAYDIVVPQVLVVSKGASGSASGSASGAGAGGVVVIIMVPQVLAVLSSSP